MNPLYDIEFKQRTYTYLDRKFAKKLGIDYKEEFKEHIDYDFLQNVFRYAPVDILNSNEFKDSLLEYMKYDATDEGCGRAYCYLYSWADRNLAPSPYPYTLWDKMMSLEHMKPKQIIALDLAKVLKDVVWESDVKYYKENLYKEVLCG